jgi:hypothetical protein
MRDTIIDMFRKKPILEYQSCLDHYPNIITPAKNHVPDWYKKIPKWKNNEMFTIERGFEPSLKHCMPFLDTLTTGYVITLPFDLYIKNNNGEPYISWKDGFNEYAPSWRPSVSDLKLVPSGCFPIEYTWKPNCSFKIPKKYTIFVTHPINRHDLPFVTLSGMIDGGFALQHDGSLPFFVKKDFEGIIPKGTPIAQLIPFLNQNWLSKNKKNLIKESKITKMMSGSVFFGWYKKTFWVRKKYD